MIDPTVEVEFTSTGQLHDPDQQAAAVAAARDATDVLVLVHGWNNDMVVARRLFTALSGSVAAATDQVPGADARRIAVVGVLWPSVRWADDDHLAGGGVGLGDEEAELLAAIAASVEDPVLATELETLVPQLEDSEAARARYLELLRTQLPEPDAPREDQAEGADAGGDEDAPPRRLRRGDPEEVFRDLSGPAGDLEGAGEASGGAAVVDLGAVPDADAWEGGAAGIGVGGILRGARSLLNLTTYYTMKRRAGDVGSNGVAGLLRALADGAPETRRHLAGHSFGARVVVAAVAAGPTVHSVSLLQGAFSHHGLAQDHDGRGNDGAFRAVLAPDLRLTGPMLVTHTANDKAVGFAYAAASRLARQRASGFGGPDDVYGGIGRNGALRTPEVVEPAGELLPVGARYDLRPGRVHNLLADRAIRSHSDITGPEVGYALLTAMTTGG
jgi:hypothetical protein